MNTDTAVLTPIAETTLAPRRVAFRTTGSAHGSITRLASPSDIGELIKPFVFLDHAVVVPTGKPMFGMHPHSGLATLTTVLSGGISYADTTGKSGELPAGGLEWMKAGNGVWHDGNVLPGEAVRLFQLWVALPPSQENSPAESQYIAPAEVQRDGPVRVIIGRHGSATSDIRAPEGINYFHVRTERGRDVALCAACRTQRLVAGHRQGPPERIRADRGRGTRRVRGIRRGAHRVACRATRRRSSSAPRSSIPIRWCSATTRCIRTQTRLRRARPRFAASVAIWPRSAAPGKRGHWWNVCPPSKWIPVTVYKSR